MSTPEDRIPVIVATAQVTERAALVRASDLLLVAASTAVERCSALTPSIQRVSVVNILSRTDGAPAGGVARSLGLRPATTETTTVGGNSPQWLVNRAAAAIRAGELEATLICGAEAQRSSRQRRLATAASPDTASPGAAPVGTARPPVEPAAQARHDEPKLAPDTVVGDDRPPLGPAEMGAGLIPPVHVYPLFESALAARAGRSFEEQRRHLAPAMAAMTEVAAANPHAWFRHARSADDLASVTPDNRLVAEPYTKRMCAVLAVDQAAAVVVCSLAAARRAGVADRAVFCWSGADCADVWFPAARPDLGRSPAIAAAARAALGAADIGVDDVDAFDLYSCFPCALGLATDALGIALDDARGLTVTGGLPYFGGPGNNYTLHAICEMADRIRDGAAAVGLVTGIGWFATKHTVGVYGSVPPPDGSGGTVDLADAQAAIDATAAVTTADVSEAATGTVMGATVTYDDAGAVTGAPVIVRLDDGRQTACRPADADPAALAHLAGRNLVGERVTVSGAPPTYSAG